MPVFLGLFCFLLFFGVCESSDLSYQFTPRSHSFGFAFHNYICLSERIHADKELSVFHFASISE